MGRFFQSRQKQYVPSLGRIAKEQAIAVSIAGIGNLLTSAVKDRWIDLPEANRKRGMETLGMVSNFMGQSMQMAIHADTIDVTNPADFLKATSGSVTTFHAPPQGAKTTLAIEKANRQALLVAATPEKEAEHQAALKSLGGSALEADKRAKEIGRMVKSRRTEVSGYNMEDKEALMRARRELSQTYRRAAVAYAELAKSTWGWGISQGYIAKEMQEGLAAKVHTIAGMAESIRKQMKAKVERPDVFATTKPSGEPSGALPDRTQGFNASLNKEQKSSLGLLDRDLVQQIDTDGFNKNKLAERVLGLYQAAQKPAAKNMLKAGLTKRGSVVIDLVGDKKELEAAVKSGDLVIMPGMRGELVKDLQVLMNHTYGSNLVVDGVYGGSLLKEVRGNVGSATGKLTAGALTKIKKENVRRFKGAVQAQTPEVRDRPTESDASRAGDLSPQQLHAIRTQSGPMRDPRTGEIIQLASSGRIATDALVTGGESTPDALAQFERQQAEGLIPESPRTTRLTSGRLEVAPPGLDVPVATDKSGYEVDVYGRKGKNVAEELGRESNRLGANQFLEAAKVRVSAKGIKGIQSALGIKGDISKVGPLNTEALKDANKTRLKFAQEISHSAARMERFNNEDPGIKEQTVHHLQQELGKYVEKINEGAETRLLALSKLSNTLAVIMSKNPAIKVAQRELGEDPADRRLAMVASMIISSPKLSQLVIAASEEGLTDEQRAKLLKGIEELQAQDEAKSRAAAAEYMISEMEAGNFRNDRYGKAIEDLNLGGKSKDDVRDIMGDRDKSPKISELMVAMHGDVFQAFYKAMRDNKDLVDELKALSKMPRIRAWTAEEADHVFTTYMYGFERGLSSGKMKGTGADPLAVLLRMRESWPDPASPISSYEYKKVSKGDFFLVATDLAKYVVKNSKRFKSDGGELTAEDYKNIYKAGMSAGKTSSGNMEKVYRRVFTKPTR